MAAGNSSTSAPPPPPAMTTGPTATWGAQHFDRAPTAEELAGDVAAAASVPSTSSASASSPAPTASPDVPSPPSTQTPQAPRPTVTDAVKTIKAADFLNVYQIPCARQGFLTGIGGGAVVGMLRYILGGAVPKAANWAVGAFAAGGIISFEVCQAARRAEHAKMKRVVEVVDRKHSEMMRQRQAEKAEKARQEAEAAAEEARRQEEQAKRRWYRFW